MAFVPLSSPFHSSCADRMEELQSIAPPQTPMNVLIPGFIVSFLSQFYALRYKPRWFEKVRFFSSLPSFLH
jgi:hypothetical protein